MNPRGSPGAPGSPPGGDGAILLPDAFERVQHPELRRFMQWYLATRGKQQMVAAKKLDPLDLKPLLACAFYYDYLPANDDFRLRLAGEEIRAVLPNARRGATLAEVIPANVVEQVRDRYRRIVTEPAVFHGIGRVFFTIGNPGYGERLVVPLADEAGRATQIFGATFYDFSETPWRGKNVSHEDVESTFIPL
jgi:PAS domain